LLSSPHYINPHPQKMPKVITTLKELDFDLKFVPKMPLPSKVLMVRPNHFSIDYVINPHMEGNVGKVDKEKALQQWEAIREAFVSTGLEMHVIEDQPGMPDMVFCANQSLPYKNAQGGLEVVMGIMHSDHRKPEVPFIEEWYIEQGYTVHHPGYKVIKDFEGMGDAIWHPGRRLLWGGYGFRSSLEAYDFVSVKLKVPVIALKLTTETFYHLDTCFCMLDEKSVLIYPGAFGKKSLELIREFIPNVYEADAREAEELFACNATCPDGDHVLIQKGCVNTIETLKNAGYTIIELETGEFLKSGGSVFCMKMLTW
jgi:N-dimethylarginine dimethylaminohydrolase